MAKLDWEVQLLVFGNEVAEGEAWITLKQANGQAAAFATQSAAMTWLRTFAVANEDALPTQRLRLIHIYPLTAKSLK